MGGQALRNNTSSSASLTGERDVPAQEIDWTTPLASAVPPVSLLARHHQQVARPDGRLVLRQGVGSTMRGLLKTLLCGAMAGLPCRWWGPASSVLRAIWPGFRDA